MEQENSLAKQPAPDHRLTAAAAITASLLPLLLATSRRR
jgi:hypothetical protein